MVSKSYKLIRSVETIIFEVNLAKVQWHQFPYHWLQIVILFLPLRILKTDPLSIFSILAQKRAFC